MCGVSAEQVPSRRFRQVQSGGCGGRHPAVECRVKRVLAASPVREPLPRREPRRSIFLGQSSACHSALGALCNSRNGAVQQPRHLSFVLHNGGGGSGSAAEARFDRLATSAGRTAQPHDCCGKGSTVASCG